MSKYNVHVFAVVRVKVCDVEADDQVQAIHRAEEKASEDMHDMFRDCGSAFETEFADEVNGYLVDNVGDEDFSHSNFYNADRQLQNPTMEGQKS